MCVLYINERPEECVHLASSVALHLSFEIESLPTLGTLIFFRYVASNPPVSIPLKIRVTGVDGLLSLICGFWEPNFGLHDWEKMLLIIEPPLQAPLIILT